MISFAIFGGGEFGKFFERVREMALRGETEVGADRDDRLVGIAEQAFCLLDFFFEDEVGQILAGFLFEACGEIAAAQEERVGDFRGADGVGEVVQDIVAHVEDEP